jgi:hypothetical protein
MFSDLFGTFPVRNAELRSVADFCNEAAWNTADEPSAGLTIGLDEHAIKRQRGWLQNANDRADAIKSRPVPDLPTTANIKYDCQYNEVPSLKAKDGKAINGDSEALVIMWQTVAYELAHSNSAAIGGGTIPADADRLLANLGAIEQFLDSIEKASVVDFPLTAAPEATSAPASVKR